ncbi:MAG TPA: hypothetical protein VK338_06440, partial [Candidatus Nitrosocosmicus sp.]|nr:hypothetical protein [Candidatus Nitrosocosmicus sp.]
MRLYEGTSKQFIQDTIQNDIADKLESSFEQYYGRRVNPREKNSWINSLQFLKNAIDQNRLYDSMVVLENELPYSNERLDCLLFGRSNNNKESAVIIELKQWSNVEDSEIDDNIITYVGGANRMEAHPSFQVRGYHYHLMDFIKCFDEENPIDLHSCAYCHNYSHDENSVLFFEKFSPILNEF